MTVHVYIIFSDGDAAEGPGGCEDSPLQISRAISDPELQEVRYSESLEQSVSDADVKD